MTDSVITVEELTKDFGSLRAVDHVSFDIREGEVFGLLGPNGAGKTTTIRMMTGLIPRTSGTVTILGTGIDEDPLKIRNQIAVLPEEADVYVDMTAEQNIRLFAELYGLPPERYEKKAENLLKRMGLYDSRKKKAKFYSKGMRQKLSLCMTLMSDAEIIFLDEPTGGLDVDSASDIREMIHELASSGATVMLTTHDMHEANELCSRVAIMNHGQIAAVDTPTSLRKALTEKQSVVVEFSQPLETELLEEIPSVHEVRISNARARCFTPEPGTVLTRIVDIAKEQGVELVSACTESATLEEVFLHVVRTHKQ
ncbi:MAG: ABC transporter ATP-binding protein [Candidatus Thorarchaeota archaeon]|nr:ABC transporter ATP-binding protein [Candidatus Thorarchaeota archaeon]